MTNEISAIIMAAGYGRRMEQVTGGSIPKPMIEMDGEPLIRKTIRLLRKAGINDVLVVIRNDDLYSLNNLKDIVRIASQDTASNPGTSKAAECGLSIVPSTPERRVIVLNGDDSSLLSPITIKKMIAEHIERGADCTSLVVPSERKTGNNRYLGESRVFLEDYNRQPKYAGVLIARYRWLSEYLPMVSPETNGEYKVTQIFGLGKDTSKIEQFILSDAMQWNDFNCPEDLVIFRKKMKASAN